MFCSLYITFSSASAGEKGSLHKGYKLVWSDDFDKETLDTTSWNIEINNNGNGNGELEYYTDHPANVTVGKDPETGASCLILTARKEKYRGKDFTSGRITTANKRVFTHGKVESRIKLPLTANGLWPAFWLLGNNYFTIGWPRCGEIDVLEMGHADGIKDGKQKNSSMVPVTGAIGRMVAIPTMPRQQPMSIPCKMASSTSSPWNGTIRTSRCSSTKTRTQR